jgi:hypothetical protein
MNQMPKICEYCNEEFVPQRKTARFCSNSCRIMNHNKNKLALINANLTINKSNSTNIVRLILNKIKEKVKI